MFTHNKDKERISKYKFATFQGPLMHQFTFITVYNVQNCRRYTNFHNIIALGELVIMYIIPYNRMIDGLCEQ